MSELKTLSVQKRSAFGKGANRRLRVKALVPGVFYASDGTNVPVQMPALPLSKIYEQVGRTNVFQIEIEDENGKTEVTFKMEIENAPEETEYKIIKGDVNGKFKIKYEKGKEKGFITVESIEGGYKLTYNNGYSEVI